MNVFTLIAFIAEIEIIIFLVWGYIHEEKLIKIERKIGLYCRSIINAVKQTVTAKGAAK